MFRNQALASMRPEDIAALSPHISHEAGARGDVLNRQGYRVENLYFPVSVFLANTVRFMDGQSALTFVVGSEGVAGLAPFLADRPSSWGVEVRAPGEMYRLPAAALRHQMDRSPDLRRQLMDLSYDYQSQASYGVGCATGHRATSRVATLILRSGDRLGSDYLYLTQEDLSEFLGMQRTTVNAAAKHLKRVGAISYRRGRIHLVDRASLKGAACECYEATRLAGAGVFEAACHVGELSSAA